MSGLQPIKGSGWLWFLGVAMIILAIIWVLNKNHQRETIKTAAMMQSQPKPVVAEKTCPEDLAKCEPCPDAKNFEWPLDSKGKPLPQMVVDVSATNCWTGYVITPKLKQFPVYRDYPETDMYIQFQDGEVFSSGPAKVVNYGKRRGIFRLMAKDKSGKVKIELDEARKIF